MLEDSRDTMRDLRFVEKLLVEARAGRPFALATVLATRRSMPRAAGARLALLADGTFMGTIGGGRVEQMGEERLRAVLAGAEEPSLEWLTHAKTGMACGGDALVGVRLCTPGEQDFLEGLCDCLVAEKRFVLSEDWSDPAKPVMTLADVEELAADDPAANAEVPLWSEEARTYAEPMGPDPIAYIFGGGHVGCALAPVLASVGFRVVVYDDREEFSRPERFPAAERVICGDFLDLSNKVQVTRRDYAVVLTHGHAADIDVLERLARVRPAYVGCIGSRAKAAFAREELARRGVDKGWLDGIHLPIGERILAVTPAEIAVSIAAEMIRCRAELRPSDARPHAGK
jgi:xanthine dehydrogenase accessory factor